MYILIYGATSRIAHECARLWAREGHRIALLGRDAERIDAVAADLRVLSGKAEAITADLFDLADAPAMSRSLPSSTRRPVDSMWS